jgi:hypothetical protein
MAVAATAARRPVEWDSMNLMMSLLLREKVRQFMNAGVL